jgi:hypothetical protein
MSAPPLRLSDVAVFLKFHAVCEWSIDFKGPRRRQITKSGYGDLWSVSSFIGNAQFGLPYYSEKIVRLRQIDCGFMLQ